MWFWRAGVLAGLILVGSAPGAFAGERLADPYDVLQQYFAASGGLERLKAERTTHREGTLSIGGMQGTVREWIQKPDHKRVEADLGPYRLTQGDNGEISWQLDMNGKVQKTTKKDEAARKRAEVDRRVAEYEYADPRSDVFTVSLQGTEEVGGVDCYVVVVTNNMNVDRITHFIRVDDFRLQKTINIRGEDSSDIYYDDYRQVGGIWVAFHVKEMPHQTGQLQETTWKLCESNPVLNAAIFDPPAEGPKDYEFTSGNAALDIPFRFIENHLFIPVVVGGKERLWILDSGAAVTVVEQAFADELGLESEGDLEALGAGGTVTLHFCTLPPYSVKGIRFKEQRVAELEMGSLVRRLGIDVAGILGYDFLSRFVTRVDYANERISFFDPESFQYTGDGHVLDVLISESVMHVPATLDGEHEGTWLLDLGAGGVFLDGVYALREGYTRKKGVQGRGHGAGSEYPLRSVRCDSIRFAGFTVHEPIVAFPYGGADTVFTADRIGILGNTLFRDFVLYLDYGNERVIAEKGEKFGQPWPRDHSGLSVGWNATRDLVEVVYASPGTPAERAGFESEDVLRSVNGIRVELLDGVLAVRKMLMEPPGTRYDFVVERAGREKRLSLKLAELY